jgi:chemotaxis protein CheZ
MSTDTQMKLGKALLLNLVKLREQKGDLSLEDVGGMFLNMASSLAPSTATTDVFMHQEIKRLAQYIVDAKQEIFAISTNDKKEQVIMDASQHLDEVIKATEKATTSIMDAADQISNMATGLGGDRAKEIMAMTSAIYEACNFQDITGQRINRVIKLLANIEERINKLNELFGNEMLASGSDEPAKPLTDKDLLNGPQLPGDASSQADIDALFASLGGKN